MKSKTHQRRNKSLTPGLTAKFLDLNPLGSIDNQSARILQPIVLVLLRILFLSGTLCGVLIAEDNPSKIAGSAAEAMSERRFSDAADLYAQLVEYFPNEPTLRANLGMALHMSSQDQKAVDHLTIAADSMPNSFPAQFFLGASLLRIERFMEALGPLQKAVSLDSDHPFARSLLGDTLEELGRYKDAVKQWDHLRDLLPENPFSYAGLVRSHEQLAGNSFDQLREQDPESYQVLLLLAHTRKDTGQYPSALYLFRRALEVGPATREIHYAVAEIYDASGRDEWATTERRRAEDLPATDCAASKTQTCMFLNGQYPQLTDIPDPATREALFWAARAHARLAEQAFQSLGDLPKSIEQLQLLASLLSAQGQYGKAADACQDALSIHPGHPAIVRQLAEYLYRSGKNSEAGPLLRDLAATDPNDPRWPEMLGGIFVREQEFKASIPYLEKATRMPGVSLSARLNLGRSYLAVDRPTEAVPHLQAALALDTDGSVHYQLAQAYQRIGNREEARRALDRYRELDEENRRRTESSAGLAITAPK